jgi:hypothetical protein
MEKMLRDTRAGAKDDSAGTGGHKNAHSAGVWPPCPLSHHFPRSAHCSTFKTEAARSSESCYSKFNIQCRESFKFHDPVVTSLESGWK